MKEAGETIDLNTPSFIDVLKLYRNNSNNGNAKVKNRPKISEHIHAVNTS
jgi:hypothetical protein